MVSPAPLTMMIMIDLDMALHVSHLTLIAACNLRRKLRERRSDWVQMSFSDYGAGPRTRVDVPNHRTTLPATLPLTAWTSHLMPSL
jgi:hypothetical protein